MPVLNGRFYGFHYCSYRLYCTDCLYCAGTVGATVFRLCTALHVVAVPASVCGRSHVRMLFILSAPRLLTMLPRLLTVAVLIGAASLASADNYAVIVVGSNTYMNYRHHADACHAYQILKAGGVPADNIVTMMYDDVASDKENPFKGKLFNKPTKKGDAGVDVYRDGCAIDYTKKAVTAKLFLSVLEGDAKAVQQELAAQGADGTGKVLNSGPNDNVFVNFVDHGGSGIIEMPNGPLLKKKDLVASLQKMHDNKRYKKLVFYMEACNSGSMFKNLPTDINVFATTAANPNEPSWGTYCPPQDKVRQGRTPA